MKRQVKLKLEEQVQRLAVEVGRLRDKIADFENIVGRVVFPAEAMGDLTGELRAIRLLLDEQGHHRFMDRERHKRERDKKRRG